MIGFFPASFSIMQVTSFLFYCSISANPACYSLSGYHKTSLLIFLYGILEFYYSSSFVLLCSVASHRSSLSLNGKIARLFLQDVLPKCQVYQRNRDKLTRSLIPKQKQTYMTQNIDYSSHIHTNSYQ